MRGGRRLVIFAVVGPATTHVKNVPLGNFNRTQVLVLYVLPAPLDGSKMSWVNPPVRNVPSDNTKARRVKSPVRSVTPGNPKISWDRPPVMNAPPGNTKMSWAKSAVMNAPPGDSKVPRAKWGVQLALQGNINRTQGLPIVALKITTVYNGSVHLAHISPMGMKRNNMHVHHALWVMCLVNLEH